MNADQTSEPTLLGRHLTLRLRAGRDEDDGAQRRLHRRWSAATSPSSWALPAAANRRLLAVLSGLLHPDGGQVMSLGT